MSAKWISLTRTVFILPKILFLTFLMQAVSMCQYHEIANQKEVQAASTSWHNSAGEFSCPRHRARSLWRNFGKQSLLGAR
jgi:hypothetical protein